MTTSSRTDETPAPLAGGRAATALLWVLLIAAVALLLASWFRPLLTVRVEAELPALFQSFTILDETRSVVSMIERLLETDYVLIAALIVVFGVVLPLAKNLGVALVLMSRPGGRARRAARALQFVGRFAMVDIFAVSIVVSIIAAGTIGQGHNPGPAQVTTTTLLRSGFYLFVAYVLLSFAIDILLAWRHRRPEM